MNDKPRTYHCEIQQNGGSMKGEMGNFELASNKIFVPPVPLGVELPKDVEGQGQGPIGMPMGANMGMTMNMNPVMNLANQQVLLSQMKQQRRLQTEMEENAYISRLNREECLEELKKTEEQLHYWKKQQKKWSKRRQQHQMQYQQHHHQHLQYSIHPQINNETNTEQESDTPISSHLEPMSTNTENPNMINQRRVPRPRDQARRIKHEIVINEKTGAKEVFRIWNFYVPTERPFLGQGTYGIVIQARDHRFLQTKVAIKKIKNVFDNLGDAKRVYREIRLLIHFRHENIIPLIGVVPPNENEIETFQDVYYVMPKADGTLKDMIMYGEYSEEHVRHFAYQIGKALKFIHSAGVFHRDLKPENILVCHNKIKVTDFGLARTMEGSDRTEYVMTRPYRAPEVMLSPKQYDSPVDMWAFGCVVAEMITRQVLFNGENYYKTLEMHFELLGCPQLEWITHADGLAWVKEKKFHEKKGKPFAELFPTANKEARDFLSKLLIMDPNQRMEASESLRHPYFASIRKRETERKCEAFQLNVPDNEFQLRYAMFETLKNFRIGEPLDRSQTSESSAQPCYYKTVLPQPNT